MVLVCTGIVMIASIAVALPAGVGLGGGGAGVRNGFALSLIGMWFVGVFDRAG